MAILDRIRRYLTTADVPANTSREITPVVRPADLRGRLLSDERGRHEIVRRCREMYATDPRAEGLLRMMARDVARSGFTLTVTGNPRAQAVADDAIRRLKLKKKLQDWVRLGARDGDLFTELGIGGAPLQIVEVTRKPTLGMVRMSDDFDRFADPAQAFAWVDSQSAAAGLLDKATFFPQFLIVHSRWNHDSESRYGTPEFAAARGAWKKLTEGELDVAIRRKARAGVRYVHTIPGADEAAIEAYKLINEAALSQPFAALADFFMNEGDIKVLDGDPRLGEIGDILHHLQTWSAASVVPLELIAYGDNLNRDVLEDKKRQYDETLQEVRAWAADEIIAPIIEREWLLHGILPETVTYQIGWPSRRIITPADLAALVAAVNAMRAAGWSPEAIWALVEPYMPDEIDADTLFAGPVPAAGEPPAFGAAEAIGAVNRLIGRLEMVEPEEALHETAGGPPVAPDRPEIRAGLNGAGK